MFQFQFAGFPIFNNHKYVEEIEEIPSALFSIAAQPSTTPPPAHKDDKRLRLVRKNFDPRVHFALLDLYSMHEAPKVRFALVLFVFCF